MVFDLNGNSASGVDGLTAHFYRVCWDIVGNDMLEVAIAFFKGMTTKIYHPYQPCFDP